MTLEDEIERAKGEPAALESVNRSGHGAADSQLTRERHEPASRRQEAVGVEEHGGQLRVTGRLSKGQFGVVFRAICLGPDSGPT